MSIAIALALRPLALFFLLACLLLPIRFAVLRYMPEGRVKRLLLLPVNDAG
jgi:uncharacterized membrane protein YhdT